MKPMRIPIRQRTRGLRFSITPLIDMTFLLIIFFLVASHFIRNETAEAVELPEATQVEEDEQSPRTLTITITADQVLHVQGKPVTLPELEELIRLGRVEHGEGYEVRIRGDRTVPYSVIEPILLASATSGVTNVKFAVLAR